MILPIATKYTSKIVTNILAHEINVIKRREQIKKEQFFELLVEYGKIFAKNTDISIK